MNEENGEKITQDLENIIKFVDQLENANTQNIEPLASPLEKTAKTRYDEVTAKNRKETFLERSPKSNDDYFLVPRVVE